MIGRHVAVTNSPVHPLSKAIPLEGFYSFVLQRVFFSFIFILKVNKLRLLMTIERSICSSFAAELFCTVLLLLLSLIWPCPPSGERSRSFYEHRYHLFFCFTWDSCSSSGKHETLCFIFLFAVFTFHMNTKHPPATYGQWVKAHIRINPPYEAFVTCFPLLTISSSLRTPSAISSRWRNSVPFLNSQIIRLNSQFIVFILRLHRPMVLISGLRLILH